PLSRTASMVFDTRGRLTTQTEALGDALQRSVLNTWNLANQLATTRDAGGNWTTYTRDGMGRDTGPTDPLGNRKKNIFDLAGQQTVSRDELGQVVQQTLNSRGWVTQTQDQLGNVVT